MLWLLPAIASAQQVYKWTDASGTVHYEEHPGGKHAQRIQLQGGVDTAATASAASVPAPASSSGALDRLDQAQRQRLCMVARDNLRRIDGQAPIVDGSDVQSARYMSDDDRLKARGDAQAQIGSYCDAK